MLVFDTCRLVWCQLVTIILSIIHHCKTPWTIWVWKSGAIDANLKMPAVWFQNPPGKKNVFLTFNFVLQSAEPKSKLLNDSHSVSHASKLAALNHLVFASCFYTYTKQSHAHTRAHTHTQLKLRHHMQLFPCLTFPFPGQLLSVDKTQLSQTCTSLFGTL